jgi:hypothetical protein
MSVEQIALCKADALEAELLSTTQLLPASVPADQVAFGIIPETYRETSFDAPDQIMQLEYGGVDGVCGLEAGSEFCHGMFETTG